MRKLFPLLFLTSIGLFFETSFVLASKKQCLKYIYMFSALSYIKGKNAIINDYSSSKTYYYNAFLEVGEDKESVNPYVCNILAKYKTFYRNSPDRALLDNTFYNSWKLAFYNYFLSKNPVFYGFSRISKKTKHELKSSKITQEIYFLRYIGAVNRKCKASALAEKNKQQNKLKYFLYLLCCCKNRTALRNENYSNLSSQPILVFFKSYKNKVF
jgi:hypothetical protein